MTPHKEFDESLLDVEIYPYFFMCECCGFVDNNSDCLNVTHPCSFCKKEGHSGVIYFHANIHAIIRLMAQIYQLKPSKKDWRHAENQSHRFTVIILFSTLGELLLNRFLGELMTAQQLPEYTQHLLLQEFKYAKERVGKLFTILTQTKDDEFRRVVKQLNPKHLETFDFYLQIQRKRNAIVHEGNIWDIPRTMPEECLHRVSSLLWMFVDVHNYYIPKLYQRRRPEHDEIEYMI